METSIGAKRRKTFKKEPHEDVLKTTYACGSCRSVAEGLLRTDPH